MFERKFLKTILRPEFLNNQILSGRREAKRSGENNYSDKTSNCFHSYLTNAILFVSTVLLPSSAVASSRQKYVPDATEVPWLDVPFHLTL